MGAARRIFTKLIRTVSIRSGTDIEGTTEGIRKNIELRGANVWLLLCAALIASIGLDVNSTAVIIGAMLISPLMSSILGVGLSVAILDVKMLKRSLISLATATLVALLVSTIYFAVSPLSQLTPELSARTTPTLLDVGVAFFGGIAGIVAGSRKEKTSAIPGVAIATALMPPLCTVGFGLAHFDASIFLGAFYLYFINSVFIVLATYLIALLLGFPKKESLDDEGRSYVTRVMLAFVLIAIVPSSYIFYNVIKKLRFEQNVKTFVAKEVQTDNREPIRWEIDTTKKPETLKVYVVGVPPDRSQKDALTNAMNNYGIADMTLSIVPLNVSPTEFSQLSKDVKTNVLEKLQIIETLESSRDQQIDKLRSDLDALKERSDPRTAFAAAIRKLDGVVSASLVTEDGKLPDADENSPVSIAVEFAENTDAEKKSAIREKILLLGKIKLPNVALNVQEVERVTDTGENNANKSQ